MQKTYVFILVFRITNLIIIHLKHNHKDLIINNNKDHINNNPTIPISKTTMEEDHRLQSLLMIGIRSVATQLIPAGSGQRREGQQVWIVWNKRLLLQDVKHSIRRQKMLLWMLYKQRMCKMYVLLCMLYKLL